MAHLMLVRVHSPRAGAQFRTRIMQCTSCRLHSDNLREYSRAVDLGSNRKTIETILLCAACRVLNAINPKYVMRRAHIDQPRAMTPA
jgi:hypothetical protein